MNNIEALIIDYGEVIFKLDFDLAKEAFKDLGISEVDSFYSHLMQSSVFDDFDKGVINASEFRNSIRDITKVELTDEAIDGAYNSLLVEIPEGIHEILWNLHQHYKTFLLSNNNEIHYEYIMSYIKNKYQMSNYDDYFEQAYFSHLMGMRKPDKEIFEKVLADHQLNPSTTLFIDDSPQHIETAQNLGMQTCLITTQNTLEHVYKFLLEKSIK